MIVQWLAYWLVLSTLLGLAAAATEAVLLRWRLETRWAWAAALLGLLALPLLGRLSAGMGSGVAGVGFDLGPIGTVAGAAGPLSSGAGGSGGIGVSTALLSLWLAGSAGVALFFYRSHRALLRLRSRWSEEVVAGEPVLVAEDSGPAVIGFLKSRILLPKWALDLDPQERELMVAHEAEHIRGGDMWLLLLSLAGVIAFPWNPVIWWQKSRLRHAMEIDCDRRVLRKASEVGEYGGLLLKVAARASNLPASAAAFTPQLSQLERRVKAMTSTDSRNRWLVAIGGSFGAMLLLLASCGIDQPTRISTSMEGEPQDEVSVAELSESPTFTPFEERPNLVDRASFGRALQENYPPDLFSAGIGGTMIVWVFIDTEGNVGNYIVEESSGYPALDQAGEAAMRQATFTPAMNDGVPVPVWIQIPITFATQAPQQ